MCLLLNRVNTFITIDAISFPRIRFLQLYFDDKWRHDYECFGYGKSRNHVHLSGVSVWPQFDIQPKRISRLSWIYGDHCVKPHVGLLIGHNWTSSHHSTNATCCLGYIDHLIVFPKLLFVGNAPVFERVFVSGIFKAEYVLPKWKAFSYSHSCSISASSATIFVYLGEFHNSRNRTNSIMGASIAAGFICILLPFIAW